MLNQSKISRILNDLKHNKHTITVLGDNQFIVRIIGEIHIQVIKEIFNVLSWKYVDGKAEFYITNELVAR